MMNRLVVLVVGVTISCSASSPSKSEDLMTAVRGYNDGLRWHNPPAAAGYLPTNIRRGFLKEREELAEDLKISDYEIARLEYVDSKGFDAAVDIRWDWYSDRKGVVHNTTTEQTWKRFGKRWLMIKELRVRGEPMPGMNEPETSDEIPQNAENRPQEHSDGDLSSASSEL